MKIKGWLCASFALLVWGVTFANTRALLVDFSALEIMVLRFALAWVALAAMEEVCGRRRLARRASPTSSDRVRTRSRGTRDPTGEGSGWTREHNGSCGGWRDEGLFVGMGLTGVFVYQFLENCAIYYTNASNVAILVSFGPIVTAVFARVFTKDRSLSWTVVGGSLIAVCGVALVSLNGVINFHMRPLGDLMALGAMTSWGVYSVLIDKANARGVAPITAIRKAFGWALVLMVPLAVWGGTESGFYALDGSFSINLNLADNTLRFARAMNWINLFFLGVLASALSFIAWSKACAALGMVRTTICLYLEPIIGVGFAALFLGERPTLMSACGGVIIIIGVVVANWRRR